MIKKIMIIAPAESLKQESSNRLFAEKRIQDYFKCDVVYGKHTMVTGFLNSAPLKDRLDDFHSAFLDTSVDVILCAKGGYNSNELLPYINWDIVKNNSKPFIGSSDITTLINAIHTVTGNYTIYGPNFIDFSNQKGFEYSMEYFEKALTVDSYKIESSKEWSNDNFFTDQKNRYFIKNDGPCILQEGKAIGILVGGNLCTFNLLQGTKYMPDLTGVILCIEDDDLVGDAFVGEFNRNLTSLLQTTDIKKINAVLIGRNQIKSNMDIDKLRAIFLTKGFRKNIPIVAEIDFGHTKPNASIPIGKMASIVAKDSFFEISIKIR